MLTEVKCVLIDDGSEPVRAETIRTDDGYLMKNRLKSLVYNYPNMIRADAKLGTELLEQARSLFQTYVAMQEINRTKQPEICHIRKKIQQNEAFYKALFGKLPDSYLETVKLQ